MSNPAFFLSFVSFTHLLDELVAELTAGAKLLDLKGHVLLGLGVEGWVLYHTVDKNP